MKFYRILFLQKTAGRLLLVSSNILDRPVSLLALNQLSHTFCLEPPQRAARKQFTLFASKNFKITKVEGNKKLYLGEAVTHRCFEKKITRKHLCRSLSLASWCKNVLKKKLLHKCFPINFIRAAFSSNTSEQFGNSDHHILFCRKYLKFWCMKQSENVFRVYCLGKLFPKNVFYINEWDFQKRFTESGMTVGFACT